MVVPTNCDPSIITLVQCIANIVTSSNLTASLTTVLKFAASLEGRATVTADINFVQKAQASLLTSANVTGNLTIPKTFNASLLATGTTTADLTVEAAASLLLDLYPDAFVAYSLRKLRTAYTGSAVKVRRSSDNTQQDIGFISGQLDTTALTTFVGAGNGFVTTWYDQSGGSNDLTQSTSVNQPQIVSSGIVITDIGGKPTLRFSGDTWIFKNWTFTLSQPYTNISVNRFINLDISEIPYIMRNEFGVDTNLSLMGRIFSGLRIYNNNNLYSSVPITLNTNYLWFTIPNGNNSRLSINNITDIGNAGSASLVNGVVLGTYSATIGQLNGFISEQIIYSGSKLSVQSEIQNNINTYYAIY